MFARIAAAAFAFATTGAMAYIPDYDIVEIYQGQDSSHAYGISNTGIVVGCHGPYNQPNTAFMWKDGQRTDLFGGCALAVNDSGMVGGYDNDGNAVIWSNGSLISLGVKGQVNSINNAGWAVASYRDYNTSPFTVNDYLYHDGQLESMPPTCSEDINNKNQILCGSSRVRNPDGTFIQLPGYDYGNGFNYPDMGAVAITDDLQAVGKGRAMLYYKDGVVKPVPHTYSDAMVVDLNSWPLMLGDEEGFFGYLADGQTSKYLSQMSGVDRTQWSKLYPKKINESGWIVGDATYGPHTTMEAWVMIPKAAPAAKTPGTPVAGLPVMPRPRLDLNADGRGDLLWHSSSGEWGVWLMDGASPLGGGNIAAPANATLVGRGDFEGNYRGDFVFRDASGAYWITSMMGTAATSTMVYDGSGGWSLVGVGDFNGDHRSDLLWYHPTMGFSVWLMNGATIAGGGAIPFLDQGWPAAIGDFNGDGRDDILWMGNDGHFELYAMNGTSATALGTVREAGTGFKPAFVADFDGDSRQDIVWVNPDGRTSLWLLDGTTVKNSTSILDAGSPWHVIGTPDLDASNTADLLFRNDDGSIGAWLMSGATPVNGAQLLGPHSGWDVAQDIEVSGDYKADLIWRSVDGSYGMWLMDGLTPTYGATILPKGSGWELAK